MLIVLDTVRADHLSCYGHDRLTTPNLDRLAAGGVRFDQAISSAPWTLPSVVALLAAEYPERVYDTRLQRSVVERLQEAGIVTAAVTEGAWVSRAFGLDLGFGSWVEEQGAVQLIERGKQPDPRASGGIERTFALAREWLAHHRDERFFLFVHTYEPHTPYLDRRFVNGRVSPVVGPTFTIELLDRLQAGEVALADEDIAYVNALYDGDLHNADRHLGSFLTFLEESGLSDRTLVVVTSDHGEEMGDHHRSHTGDHGHALYDSLLRVPLIVHDPLRSYPVRAVRAQVRLLDVLPTIADRLGVVLAGGTDGTSLVPWMAGEKQDERIALSGHTRAGPARIGVRALGYKYIRTIETDDDWPSLDPPPPPRELYDLSADPGERRNLATAAAKLAATMDDLLRANRRGLSLAAPPAPDRSVDPELMERLRSLGYLR